MQCYSRDSMCDGDGADSSRPKGAYSRDIVSTNTARAAPGTVPPIERQLQRCVAVACESKVAVDEKLVLLR